MNAVKRCAGMVLAGGRASRLGGGFKAAANLPGGTMLAHVLRRLESQASPVAVSVSPDHAVTLPAIDSVGAACILRDRRPAARGPLAGLCAGLEWVASLGDSEWLLLCPCDAPFLPPDLGVRLAAAAEADAAPLAMARYEGHPQPVFSLWRADLETEARALLEAPGQGGLMALADRIRHVCVDWPQAEPSPFFNVNTPAELARARRWLDR